jgi:hypothetical protein
MICRREASPLWGGFRAPLAPNRSKLQICSLINPIEQIRACDLYSDSPPLRRRSRGSCMARKSDENFELLTRQLRRDVGLDDRFCPDMIHVLDQLRRLDRIEGYRHARDEDLPDEAFFDANEREFVFRESTWRALDHPTKVPKNERRAARFTAAHELAHFALGHAGVNFRGPTSARAKQIPSRVRTAEFETGPFAGAFLLPAHLADPDLPAEDLADLFDVNLTPATIRKVVLERMARRMEDRLRPLPTLGLSYLREQKERGFNVTSLPNDGKKSK